MKAIMRALATLALVLAARAQETHTIRYGFGYRAGSVLEVNVGDTVHWTGLSGFHTLTWDAPEDEAKWGTYGKQEASWTFGKADVGDHSYYCRPHKGSMRDYHIDVQGGATGDKKRGCMAESGDKIAAGGWTTPKMVGDDCEQALYCDGEGSGELYMPMHRRPMDAPFPEGAHDGPCGPSLARPCMTDSGDRVAAGSWTSPMMVGDDCQQAVYCDAEGSGELYMPMHRRPMDKPFPKGAKDGPCPSDNARGCMTDSGDRVAAGSWTSPMMVGDACEQALYCDVEGSGELYMPMHRRPMDAPFPKGANDGPCPDDGGGMTEDQCYKGCLRKQMAEHEEDFVGEATEKRWKMWCEQQCGDMGGPDARTCADCGVQISIQNFAFDPPRATVDVGGCVCWTNRDRVGHSVQTAKTTNAFSSGDGTLGQGESYKWTPTAEDAGDHAYYCLPHQTMTGGLQVIAGDKHHKCQMMDCPGDCRNGECVEIEDPCMMVDCANSECDHAIYAAPAEGECCGTWDNEPCVRSAEEQEELIRQHGWHETPWVNEETGEPNSPDREELWMCPGDCWKGNCNQRANCEGEWQTREVNCHHNETGDHAPNSHCEAHEMKMRRYCAPYDPDDEGPMCTDEWSGSEGGDASEDGGCETNKFVVMAATKKGPKKVKKAIKKGKLDKAKKKYDKQMKKGKPAKAEKALKKVDRADFDAYLEYLECTA